MIKSLDRVAGRIKSAALVLAVARCTLVYVIQPSMQALLVLNLVGDLCMAIQTEHRLVLLQWLVTQAAVVLKISVRVVILQNYSW